MKSLLTSALILLFASPLMALESPAPKHGVINMQEIILNVADGKAARASLEKEIKEKEAYFLKQKQELDRLNEEWEKQSKLLSEEAKIEKQKEFQKKFMTQRNAEGEFQQQIKQKEMEATQKIAMKAAKIADELMNKNNLEIVYEANQAGIVAIRNAKDLTKEAIALYDADVSNKKEAKPESKKDEGKKAK
jgi:outer membrane protein